MAKKHIRQVRLTEPYPAFFHRAKAVFQQMGWQYIADTGDRLEYQSPMNLSSWGENFSVRLLNNEEVEIKSQCRLPTQIVDWGRNKKNVNRFLEKMGYDPKA